MVSVYLHRWLSRLMVSIMGLWDMSNGTLQLILTGWQRISLMTFAHHAKSVGLVVDSPAELHFWDATVGASLYSLACTIITFHQCREMEDVKNDGHYFSLHPTANLSMCPDTWRGFNWRTTRIAIGQESGRMSVYVFNLASEQLLSTAEKPD